MAHTIVVSDVHLWDALPGDGLWMRYRQRRYFPDDSLASMLDAVTARVGRDDLEVVFNGDVFDFDVAPVRDGRLDHDARCVTERDAVNRLSEILDEHPVFLAAVGRLLLLGKRVVFVAGNHDVQLLWPGVQSLLADRLVAAALSERPSGEIDRNALRSQITFRAWFHRTEHGIHIEHGNQYDRYCAFTSPLGPFVDDGTRVEPNVGSLVVHHIIGRLGYFNPNLDASFLLSRSGYARHFFRHYAFARESLVATWSLGTLRVAWSLLKHQLRSRAASNRSVLDDQARRFDLDEEALAEHLALAAPAGVHDFLRSLRLDRAALVAVIGSAAVLTITHPRTALGFALGALGAFGVFQVTVPEKSLSETYDHVRQCQRRIARLHGARAVVFGHTHEAYGHWDNGVFYGNCGTWSPRFHDVECTVPYEAAQPFVWLHQDANGTVSGGLHRFRDGRIEADDAPIELKPEEVGSAA